jgi:hypothetical protein
MFAIVEATYPDGTTETGIAMCLGLCACDEGGGKTHREWETPLLRTGKAIKVEILREIGTDDEDTRVTQYKISDLVKL